MESCLLICRSRYGPVSYVRCPKTSNFLILKIQNIAKNMTCCEFVMFRARKFFLTRVNSLESRRRHVAVTLLQQGGQIYIVKNAST